MKYVEICITAVHALATFGALLPPVRAHTHRRKKRTIPFPCCVRVRQGKGITIPTEESKKILRREEDLNGVNPFFAILGAAGAAAMSFGSWKVNLRAWQCAVA